MNEQEQKAIDEATAKAESELIIQEAVESSESFHHFLLGWMMNTHHKEMAEAAESWIETMNFKLPEED